jgi:hypothetical protein
MPANTAPIFALTPVNTWLSGAAANAATAGVTANTSKDGSSGTVYGPIFTGGANGSRIDFVRLRALGTNVATVCRVWLNNGGVTTTAANNALLTEATIAATTVSEIAALVENTITLNQSIPTGYKIYLTFGTATAAGFHATAVGGDY